MIDIELLVKERLANRTLPVKLLNKGSLEKSFTIKVNAASEAAKEAVKKAGGSVEVI